MIGILTFCSIFTLISAGGFFLFNREKKPRISSIFTDPNQTHGLAGPLQQAGASLGTFVSRFDSVVPKTKKDVSILRQRLIRAGLREKSAVNTFYGSKFILMLAFLIIVLSTGLASVNYFMIILVALGVGFLAPDFWLTRRIKARKRQIRLALPDVLDLLVVCVEAGLSLDLALSRAAQEIAGTRSAIADEFSVLRLEQSAGCLRADAWKHLAERTGVDSVRYLASILIQSEQLGTSISRSLRVYSQALRTQRIQQLEEQAAKAGIKIVFPLALFIFPNLFLVVLGPALMEILDSLSGIVNR
jgi:tight adherence protein C